MEAMQQQGSKRSAGRSAAAPDPTAPPLSAGQPRSWRCGAGSAQRGLLRLPPAPRIRAAGGGVPFPAARHVRRCACCVRLLRSSKRVVRLRTLLPPPLCKPSVGSAAGPAALHSHALRR